ncbi:hypothetical protein F4803DRAFT_571277 [Xylaria telfairii]|nr:hypothetical protein F4803DRAFT_571277 [Xylaria telfairii]
MASLDYHIVASACDKKLLLSEEYWDTKVECGDQSWPVHKIILSTRCPFFAKWFLKSTLKSDDENPARAYRSIKMDDQDPVKMYWVIYFIYTGQCRQAYAPFPPQSHKDVGSLQLSVPVDLIGLLKDVSTAMSTCLELFALGEYFELAGLRKRATDVLMEHIFDQASIFQEDLRLESLEDTKENADCFIPHYLGAVRTVYGGADSDKREELKKTLLRYIELTGYVVLREEFLGKALCTDSELAGFLADILKATFFKSFGCLERKGIIIDVSCAKCDQKIKIPKESGSVIWENMPGAWCRRCNQVGVAKLMMLLGDDRLISADSLIVVKLLSQYLSDDDTAHVAFDLALGTGKLSRDVRAGVYSCFLQWNISAPLILGGLVGNLKSPHADSNVLKLLLDKDADPNQDTSRSFILAAAASAGLIYRALRKYANVFNDFRTLLRYFQTEWYVFL